MTDPGLPLPGEEGLLPPARPGDADEAAVDGDPDPSAALVPPVADAGDASLLGLIDRLAVLLDHSDLSELEVEAGGTGLVLRKPAVAATQAAVAVEAGPVGAGTEVTGTPATRDGDAAPVRPSVAAPLTGIYYAAPAPGSPPYVQVGGEVAVGQIIGLIEAMKLFNEIKSDLAGRVVRIVAESGQLVKAKQPLIEVEPL
jgi:acetyl-CoA carboxylase biotin carboxyl carrier protein